MANRHSEWVNMTAQQIIDRLADSGYTVEEIRQVAEYIFAPRYAMKLDLDNDSIAVAITKLADAISQSISDHRKDDTKRVTYSNREYTRMLQIVSALSLLAEAASLRKL